ncbi:MAG: hypothetical protein R3223_01360 [Longimicrobiales bacterium]|nr:hypothetical protein [Longimicrobiales bacterium]
MNDRSSSRPFTGTVTRGILAGLVGATAMAIWFLVIDASQGTPFRTPAFLAHAVLGREQVQLSVGAITLYTFIHYGAFVLVGVVVSWLLRMIHTAPTVLLGFVLGFLLFDVVFYTSVTITGVNVVTELGWPEVLAGNLIAGVSLMGFLHLTGATPPVTWWEALVEDHIVIREGLVSGLVGALTVAVWFFLFDLIRGEPFFTPGALGSALFLGATSLADVTVNAGTVLGYSVFHVLAFVVTGMIATAFVVESERRPPVILGAILLFITFEAFFMGFVALVGEFLLGPLAWWEIAFGNLLATVSMGYYLWKKHPKLQAAIMANPLDQTV